MESVSQFLYSDVPGSWPNISLLKKAFFTRDAPVSSAVTLLFPDRIVELVWHSGSVMDCHAKAGGSIPSGNCTNRASCPSWLVGCV